MLYDVNLGVRDYFTYTDAMLNNSLFSYYMQEHGMNVYKGETTRDLVCLDFDYGSKDYQTELSRLQRLLGKTTDPEKRAKIETTIEKVHRNKDKYRKRSREEIRDEFYENGVSITYDTRNKDGSIKSSETIHYRMLFRTSAKAKLGQVIFINENLYDVAHDWLTMGLGKKLPAENAKIVELSAYAPLTTSTIVGSMHIPVEDILILKDQDSFFHTFANVVRAKDGENGRKMCYVSQEEYEVKNTLWDGMGLIESEILPDWVNGMALLRNHMFKMCGFRTHIKKFFVDWCYMNDVDYYTYQVEDMFGVKHYLKDIKVITTDNAIKWKKFTDLMGNNLREAYGYWCERIKADGDNWGIVKTDHPSKLGKNQQMSYQMINTLPCSKEDIFELAETSCDYVDALKCGEDLFDDFLRKNANEVNHYEMLSALFRRNPEFAKTSFYRQEKRDILSNYVFKLRNGKIFVNADNLTVCGNPYALLLYSVGDDWQDDPCFDHEDGTIQCYTRRFADDEFLCAIRNPHNSPENIGYLHNVYSAEMERYFEFSNNIIAVNCIQTDIQSRLNGMDFDSDFMFVTNSPVMVRCAKIAYRDYHTIVNDLQESGVTYSNTALAYSTMDNNFARSRLGIGWSSNLAQLALTYYWTELQKPDPDEDVLRELHDNFIILSVIAQVVIDSCKRLYEVDGMDEINRIQKMPCMNRYHLIEKDDGTLKQSKFDFPQFMAYTRKIAVSKDGKARANEDIQADKGKLKNRIDDSLVCPMNWLQERLNKIQNASTYRCLPTKQFFIKMTGAANNRQMAKITETVEEYIRTTQSLRMRYKDNQETYRVYLYQETEAVIEKLQKIKIRNLKTINRLIEVAIGLSSEVGNSKRREFHPEKYPRKLLALLYRMDKDKFLSNFIPQ